MSFEIFKTFPPDRESACAEIVVRRNGIMEIHAEVFRVGGELTIRMFPPIGGEVWQYPLDEWMRSVERAAAMLGPDA